MFPFIPGTEWYHLSTRQCLNSSNWDVLVPSNRNFKQTYDIPEGKMVLAIPGISIGTFGDPRQRFGCQVLEKASRSRAVGSPVIFNKLLDLECSMFTTIRLYQNLALETNQRVSGKTMN